MLPPGNPNDFFRRTKSATVSAARNLIGLHLIRSPAAGTGWRSTRTIQSPFLAGSSRDRNQVGAISVRAEADKITHRALRTFHAMTNPPRHNMPTSGEKVSKLQRESRTKTDLALFAMDVFGPLPWPAILVRKRLDFRKLCTIIRVFVARRGMHAGLASLFTGKTVARSAI